MRFITVAFMAAFLLPAAFAQSSVEIPAQKGNTSTSVSGTVLRIDNPSGVLLPTFAEKITGSPSTVSIPIQACMTGDVQGDNCVTLETNTSTAARQIRNPPTSSIVYDYFLITPSWTGGTSPTVTINSTLSPNARSAPSSISGNAATATALAGTPSQCGSNTFATGIAASGNANCTGVVNASLPVGVVTDDKASLAVKPAVTVVASANTALSGLLTIDSVVTADGSIVLATAQTTGSENGPWVVHSGAWTRPTWYTSGSTTQASQFLTTFVRLGTLFQGSTWRMTTAGVTIDTTATTWTQTPIALNANSVVGTVPVANGGFGSAGTNYWLNPGYNNSTFPAVANRLILGGVVIPMPIPAAGKIVFQVTTFDNTNNSDVCLYTKAGTLLAHIGAQHLGTAAPVVGTITGGPVAIPAGPYYVGFTSVGTTLVMSQAASTQSTFFSMTNTTIVTSGGACPASITPPVDAWAFTVGQTLSFGIAP